MRLWYVYIARCGDGTLYTGVALDRARRLAQHADGAGARYTRGRGGVALHHWEAASSKGAALRREAAIKRLTRAGKLALADPPGFRPATADDLPWIRRTLHAFGLDDDRAEHAQFTVAMAGRARAGFARIKPRGSFFELSGVAVLPRYRRRGLGAALVRHLLERWPSRRAWIVTMRPEWFRRLGFETARPPKALARKLKAHGHCCATAMRRDIERM